MEVYVVHPDHTAAEIVIAKDTTVRMLQDLLSLRYPLLRAKPTSSWGIEYRDEILQEADQLDTPLVSLGVTPRSVLFVRLQADAGSADSKGKKGAKSRKK